MVVRKTLQWIATLLLLAGVGGGGYSYWFFTHSDEQLRAKIYEFVGKKLPNARLEIGRAWFWGHKVHLQNVLLSANGLDQPLARCHEIVITLDGEELSDQLRIDIRAVHVVRPDVRVVRDASGHWNWEKLLPLPEPDDITPEVDFDDLQIGLQLAHSNAEMAAFHVQQGGIRLVPSAHKVFQVQADLRLPTVGDIHLDGGFDLVKRTWRLSGGTESGTSIGDLVDSMTHAFPDAGGRLAAFEQTLRSSVRTASREGDAAGAEAAEVQGDSSSPRFSGLAKFQFELRRDSSRDPLVYKVLAELAQGEIEHPLLPFGLHAVSGKIFADNTRLILRNVEAQNGTTHLDLNGEIKLPVPAAGNRVDIKVTDLPLDERLRARLPPGLQRLYNMIRPAGQIDAAGSLVCGVDGFEPVGWTFAAKHCALTHEKFPYPITDVVGTGIQRGSSRVIDVDLHGKAGSRPVHLTGRVLHPGPEAESDFEFDVAQLPVDDVLLSAAVAQPALQRTLSVLNLHGLFDVHCRFHRPPGRNEKIEWWMDGRLSDGALEYEVFPYRITDFAGRFSFESPTGTWKFDELQGRHGAARLWGAGSFVKRGHADRGTLKLDIGATDVALERDFEQAFPEYSRKMWDLIFPSGKLKTQVSLTWNPGSKPLIEVPLAIVSDGSLEIRSFPYPLDHVNAQFAYGRDPGSNSDRILIFAFQAQHDETRITIDPVAAGPDGRQQSFILCPPADDPIGEWRIHLQRMHVDALNPDQTLRRALPSVVRNTVNALNPRGKVSLDGMLELRGTRRPTDPVTAAWSFETILSGETISTGIELTNVHGSVKSWGLWDGHNVSMRGRVDLNSMYIFGSQQFGVVKGPFELDNQDLVVGSRKAFVAQPAGTKAETIDDAERMTARFVSGAVLLDATAHLDADKTRFRVKALLRNANLREYARLYMPSQGSLRGVLNGWVDLSSNTPNPKDVTGRGQLLIHPAALYELPVFVQIFKAFSLAPPDNTAFNYALTNFTIGRRQFDFREIDLIGDAISLRGQGKAGFDGTLDLNFYSRPAGAWQRSIFRDLANQFGQGWIGVRVRGTVQQPQAKTTGAPQMNDAFRRFLDAFNPPPGGLPPVNPPWMNSSPMMPMGNNPQPATATH
jgi:AsmA-like C-terminal region